MRSTKGIYGLLYRDSGERNTVALKLFISYSRIDSSAANTLYADLQARGFEPWMDTQRLEGGDNFTRYIQAAINASDVLLLLLTPSAVASQWVELEYTYAKNQGKRIIPLKMGAELPLVLTTTNFIDFEHGYERGREQLLLAITTPERRPTDPLNYDELYQEAVRAMTERDYERADAVLKRIPTDFRGGAVAQIRQGMQPDLRRQRITNFRAQADAARQAGELDRYAGALEALLQEDPQDATARAALLAHYRTTADAAYARGAYQDAFVAWAALLKLDTTDAHAVEYRPVAEANAKGMPFYDDARTFVQKGDIPAAQTALDQVWRIAPYYGDPEGLAKVAGKDVPMGYEDEKIAKQREEAAAAVTKERQNDAESAMGGLVLALIVLVLAVMIAIFNPNDGTVRIVSLVSLLAVISFGFIYWRNRK